MISAHKLPKVGYKATRFKDISTKDSGFELWQAIKAMDWGPRYYF
jgi:hypothetical protein